MLGAIVAVLPSVRPGTGFAQGAAAERAPAPSAGVSPRPRDLNQLAREYRGLSEIPLLARVDEADLHPGRVDTFWIGEQGSPGHFQIQAELRLVTRHAYWYVQPGTSMTDSALARASESFERVIYPSVRRLVGSESFPGLDNDPRITIVNGNVPGVAGYVSSTDTYSIAVSPYSNEREIVYLNTRSMEPGSSSYLGVLAHEFTHVVHEGVNPSEATWLKEGTADAVASRILPQRGVSYAAFFAHPDLQVTAWGEGPAGAEYYESAALFMRYFLDRFGEDALNRFLRRSGLGILGLDAFLASLGETVGFEGLFRDWTAATATGVGVSADFPLFGASLNGSPRAQRLSVSGRVNETVAQFGADYYEVGPGVGEVRFAGATTVASLPTDPHTGSAVWYGGREDAAVAVLTREVDLTDLERAELRYWTWFDLEPDYDFAYVSISRDGGRSWSLLQAPGMSSNNASGNNLGQGYTGRSGGADRPGWVRATLDLTPYVGGRVLIRFTYVTDDAVTRDGIAVDDIELAPLGIIEGAEQDSADWTAEGWMRLPKSVTQRWSVQVLMFDGGRVEREIVPIDGSGRGTWAANGRRFDRAMAIVSGVTPNTLQAGAYTLEAN